MGKKVLLAVMTAALCALLAGCFPWSAEDSYKLPKPPRGYENLTAAVSKTRRELELEHSATVEDVPPATGDNTSAVQLLDMDDDGTQETAVTFFRVVGAELPLRICFYTQQEDERYVLTGVVRGEGDSVYAVHYADVDGIRDPRTGRTCKEVVVSWQLGGQANYLGVYAVNEGDGQMLASAAYDSYRLTDLDQNGLMEVAIGTVDRVENTGKVTLYGWNTAEDIMVVQETALSVGTTAIRSMRANFVKEFAPALYVVSDLLDGSKAVDVIAMKNAQPVNLALDKDGMVSRECSSSYRDLTLSDVNSDNILELPRPRQLESYPNADGSWLADWVQYDARGRASTICTTYHCVVDGWYLVIPDHWQSRLVIYRNDTVSGQRAVVFALWQGEDKEPLPFLSIYRLTGASRSLRATSGNRFVLAEDSNTIYAAAFYNTWDCGLDENELLENFRLIVSSWSGE
ncbi:MAG: hypothetical protein IJB75_01710 [Oscillospiraceae bacterium]|nr:hypothetical protein [Oscillospiraceae bacterium]